MGEDRAGPAGEDCRHPVTFAGERPVSDRVHAPMHAMQAPGRDTTSYGASTQAELEKLDQGDYPCCLRASSAMNRSTGGCGCCVLHFVATSMTP
jgi:hypothetical protein